MVENQNVEVRNRLAELTKVSPSSMLPNSLSNSIQPTLDLKPFSSNIVKQGVIISAGSTTTTLYTTSTTKDFYITGACLSVIKDVTNPSVAEWIQCYIGGALIPIIYISSLALTAQSESNTISFPYPIKVDRNTVIELKATNTTASITLTGVIYGIETEAQ